MALVPYTLVPYIRKRHLKKGELLLEQGRIDRNFYTVQHGLLRNFIIRDGEEWTRWFAVSGDVVCSMAGVARGLPAIFSIDALEETDVMSLNKSDLMQACMGSPSLSEWLFRLCLDGFCMLEESYLHIEHKAAISRYMALECNFSREIINMIPLQYIASYIGIKPETLSRIRHKRGAHDSNMWRRCSLYEHNREHTEIHPFCRYICLKRNV